MFSSPIVLLKPPGCDRRVKFVTRDPVGARPYARWSDGKCEPAQVGSEPILLKIPGGNELFWSDECELIGCLDPAAEHGPTDRWNEIPFPGDPDEQDYFDALARGLANNHKKMRQVRTRLWWIGNEPIRVTRAGALSAIHLDNLARLALLLSETIPDDMLLRAEAFREMGYFADALRLLENDFPADLQAAASVLRRLCAQQDTRVALLPATSPNGHF